MAILFNSKDRKDSQSVNQFESVLKCHATTGFWTTELLVWECHVFHDDAITVYDFQMDHHYVPVTFFVVGGWIFLSFFFFFISRPCFGFRAWQFRGILLKMRLPSRAACHNLSYLKKETASQDDQNPLTRKQLKRALDSSLKCHWCKNRCNGLACFRAFCDISVLIPHEYQSLHRSHSRSIILFKQTNTDLSNLVQSVVWCGNTLYVLDIPFAQPELY